jgi:hypothetical protein
MLDGIEVMDWKFVIRMQSKKVLQISKQNLKSKDASLIMDGAHFINH